VCRRKFCFLGGRRGNFKKVGKRASSSRLSDRVSAEAKRRDVLELVRMAVLILPFIVLLLPLVYLQNPLVIL
jgi:hypothetical protein